MIATGLLAICPSANPLGPRALGALLGVVFVGFLRYIPRFALQPPEGSREPHGRTGMPVVATLEEQEAGWGA